MNAAATWIQDFAAEQCDEPQQTTLLALVRAVGEVTEDDAEVVATVLHMIRTGSVRLCGNMLGEPVEAFDD